MRPSHRYVGSRGTRPAACHHRTRTTMIQGRVSDTSRSKPFSSEVTVVSCGNIPRIASKAKSKHSRTEGQSVLMLQLIYIDIQIRGLTATTEHERIQTTNSTRKKKLSESTTVSDVILSLSIIILCQLWRDAVRQNDKTSSKKWRTYI